MPGPGWSTHELNPNRMQIERTDFAVVVYEQGASMKTLEQLAEDHWGIKHFCGSDGGNGANTLGVSLRVACGQNRPVRFRIKPRAEYEQRVRERDYVGLKEQRAQQRKAMHAARKDAADLILPELEIDSRPTDLHFGAQRGCSENEASAKIDDGATCCCRCNVWFRDRHENLFCCSSCRHSRGHTKSCMRRRAAIRRGVAIRKGVQQECSENKESAQVDGATCCCSCGVWF